MLTKFQRNFSLEVQGNDNQVHIFNYPLTLELQIKRDVLASANTATFRVYNLGSSTRNLIYKDQFSQSLSFRSLVLKAGYGDTLPIVFNGNVKMAQSFRQEKSVNFITEIQGFDYGWVMTNAQSAFNLIPTANTPTIDQKLVINRLIKDLQGSAPGSTLGVGAVSNQFTKKYVRGLSIAGPTWQKLQDITENNAYIDNGKVFCLFENDVFDGDLTLIDSTTGLLGTPKKADRRITVETIFEPRLQVGQQVQLNSRSLTQFNGNYKVVGIEHQGTISGAVGGELKTIVSLLLPFDKINVLTGITP